MKRTNKTIKTIYANKLLIVCSFFCLFIFVIRTMELAMFDVVVTLNSKNNISSTITLKEFALNRNTVTKELPANRGTIYDVTGDPIAKNVLSYTVIAYLDPSRSENSSINMHVVDKEETAKVLSEYINMSEETILDLLNKKGYQVELGPGGRNISRLLKDEIEKLNLEGIDFIPNVKRFYPYGTFSSYTVGYARKYVNDDNTYDIIGEMGIEGYFNSELTGTDGQLVYQSDVKGIKLANTPEIETPAVDGHDIYLTIDKTVQVAVERVLNDAVDKYNPNEYFIAVMDAKTGAILGVSSYPTFDPNIKNIVSYTNPLVSFAHEPGSIMKIYTYMAAIENNKYFGNNTFKSGIVDIYGTQVSDWNNVGWGTITYDEGFARSSNTGIVSLLTDNLTKNELKDYFKLAGFGSITNITLPNESAGSLPFNYPIEVANAGFGQGISTTPIQQLQALTAISNDGVLLKPYIVDRIVDSNTNEVITQFSKEELNRVASVTTVNYMKDLMEDVINSDAGTGRDFYVENLDIIGKTGTAQIPNENGRGYMSGPYNYIKSFIGMYPKNDPEVIIYAYSKQAQTLKNPLTDAVKDLAISVSKYLNIESESVDVVDFNNGYELKSFINQYVSKTDILNDITNLNLSTYIVGNGDKIIKQYPNPNTVLYNNEKIFFQTNYNEVKAIDFTGFSSKDIQVFCDFANINCVLNGYGYVVNSNIEIDQILIKNETYEFDLMPKF